MRSDRTRKALAGFGTATILLGTSILVGGPGAGAADAGEVAPTDVVEGNLKCADLGLAEATASFTTEVRSDANHADPTLHVDWTAAADTTLGTVIVKQGTSSAVFTYEGATSGTAYVAFFAGENGDLAGKAQGYSHVSFCDASPVEDDDTTPPTDDDTDVDDDDTVVDDTPVDDDTEVDEPTPETPDVPETPEPTDEAPAPETPETVEVAGDETTPTVDAAIPAPQVEADADETVEVLDQEVAQTSADTLPRTGADSTTLLTLLALALLALGGAMTFGSTRLATER